MLKIELKNWLKKLKILERNGEISWKSRCDKCIDCVQVYLVWSRWSRDLSEGPQDDDQWKRQSENEVDRSTGLTSGLNREDSVQILVLVFIFLWIVYEYNDAFIRSKTERKTAIAWIVARRYGSGYIVNRLLQSKLDRNLIHYLIKM